MLGLSSGVAWDEVGIARGIPGVLHIKGALKGQVKLKWVPTGGPQGSEYRNCLGNATEVEVGLDGGGPMTLHLEAALAGW